jgi:sugar phosphate isomerase/epimerase
MRFPIGLDSSKLPGAAENDAAWVLRRAHHLGMQGVFFRSAFDLSAHLDFAEMSEVAQLADELGMYVEVGIGKVNPFALPETPEIRALGDGDTIMGLRRMIEACAQIGVHELWSATANYQFALPGRFAYDRFRTDVSWADQLSATEKVLHRLAPALRDAGSHLNIETHEEITTFELVRLIEAGGADAFGITFDTGNVVCRGEHPLAAARRIGRYARCSHVRDVAVHVDADGLERLLVPCGQGVIDWSELLSVLVADSPRLTLSIEGITVAGRAPMRAQIDDPEWRESHIDLAPAELDSVVGLARTYAARAAAGEVAVFETLRGAVSERECTAFFTDSARHLRATLATLSTLDRPITSTMGGA